MSGQPHRLAQGGLIDRASPLAFSFDGRPLQGYAGDTLASALLANGVRLVGRSFKYHRPRGILTAGIEEPNALVTLGHGAAAEPNIPATVVPLSAGLEAASQNRWPSLAFDAMAVNGLLSPIFVAGFYYKTLMWPAGWWEKVYEPIIRRAAGLGALSGEPDPDSYDRDHAFCDVLVIGAGPAGLAAALTAARAGARVLVLEQDVRLGGRLLSERHEIDGKPGAAWAQEAAAELAAAPNVRVLPRTLAFGAYDGGVFGAVETLAGPGPRQRYWKIKAKAAVLCAGAVERPIAFGGNDRPGVMTAGAVSSYLNRHAVRPGERVAVFTTADSGWSTVDDLRRAGVAVAAVVDARPEASSGLDRRKDRAGAPVHLGAHLICTRGGKALRSIVVRDASGAKFTVEADTLAVAGGWNPSFALGCHLGARPLWDAAIHAFVLASPPAGLLIAGAAAGRLSLAATLADGRRAGAEAAAAAGLAASQPPFRAEDEPCAVAPLWHVAGSKGKAFVDLQNDVTVSDVALAEREGYRSVEHLKRYTTLGMGTDQGKTSALIGQAVAAELSGRRIDEMGQVLARPPYAPVSIGLLAGDHRGKHFRPTRLPPSHAWAEARGAAFVDSGAWKRAQWFAQAGETDWLATVSREVRAVRNGVGICDVSTLGKIEVCGPDAGALLDRVYINSFGALEVGRTRYGVMLREDGFVFDDGSASRFAEDRYFVTTTTANAARVMQHLDFCRQVLWPQLDVQAVSVTDQWAQVAVAGPSSRALLQRLLPDHDLSNEAFPFMAARELTWAGLPARLYRLSFSGELAYEIAVPAAHGEALMDALMEAGQGLGVAPYGVEALGVMRIEKGHVGGGELNGQTTAKDLGLGRMMSRRKDCIGQVMAVRPGITDPDRPALVGITPVDPAQRLRAGAHLLPVGAPAVAARDQGHVTSVAWSPSLERWIGLALLKGGPARHGERVRAYDPVRSGDVEVEVRAPVFVDPEGARVRG